MLLLDSYDKAQLLTPSNESISFSAMMKVMYQSVDAAAIARFAIHWRIVTKKKNSILNVQILLLLKFPKVFKLNAAETSWAIAVSLYVRLDMLQIPEALSWFVHTDHVQLKDIGLARLDLAQVRQYQIWSIKS